MAQTFDAIVIGAGHNGLVAAAELSRKGKRVCVIERADLVGGMARSGELDGVALPQIAHLLYNFAPVVAKDLGLDLKAVAKAVGAKRAVMAEPADAERVTGYVVGGISPLGGRKRLPAVIDDSALALDRIYVSGGRRGLDISLAPAELVRLTGATTAVIGKDS